MQNQCKFDHSLIVDHSFSFFLLWTFVQTSTTKYLTSPPLFFRAIDRDGYLHGCNVLYELVKPFANTDAVVVADSYFASVGAAIRLKEIGLRFIGVVKTATKEYPMRHLASVVLPEGRGSRCGLLTTDEHTGTQLLAFVWVDRDRRYFISTCSSLAEGNIICRQRWSQVNKEVNAEPERQERRIRQPKAAETYYTGCSKIDQHNRHRQDTLRLERKLQTNEWHKRVNITIMGMIVVDAYLLGKACSSYSTGGNGGGTQRLQLNDPNLFIERLAEQLIDNDYDRRTTRHNTKRSREVMMPATTVIDTSLYLTNTTPTKRLKKNKTTGKLSQCKQGRCMVCKKAYPTTVCRECQKAQPDPTKTQYWCCKSGSKCFDVHVRSCHPDKLLIRAHLNNNIV